ncbi:MAG: M14 family zinc carboxypeptidase [Bacteroidota bacterium]
MRRVIVFFCFFFGLATLYSQTTTPFEADPEQNTTAEYHEAIAFYEALAQSHPTQFRLDSIGATDSGQPLHLGILSKSGIFDPSAVREKGDLVLFVNNAIHPGEACGVDATMMLVRDFLEKPNEYSLPADVTLVFIPFYNIGGGLNRGSYSRANQNGPYAYGFRGNAKNLDLNRDFIKTDSKNAQAFNQAFTKWNPELFIDNHTSNGADYQYSLTLIATQVNKMSAPLAAYLTNDMLPHLYKDLRERGWEMTPYVYVQNTPDEGIAGFLDLPRYSTGYATLHHTIGFMPETHMLKPFKNRVWSVYHFMSSMIDLAHQDKAKILAARKQAIEDDRTAKSLDINWTIDPTKVDTVQFKGYEAKYKPSKISGIDRLYYDHEAPWTKTIPFFNTYKVTTSVEVPTAYVLPQAYSELIQRLEWNGVKVHRLAKDTVLQYQQYYIEEFDTRDAYEAHYLHSNVQVRTVEREWHYQAGDFVIFTDQNKIRYIVETLEPQAPDSYFAWNFFDGILQQKEYFSSYVFEDLALEYLEENPDLQKELEAKKAEDPKFAESGRAQLDFVYKRSPHYEPTHRLYPVSRWFGQANIIPLEKAK